MLKNAREEEEDDYELSITSTKTVPRNELSQNFWRKTIRNTVDSWRRGQRDGSSPRCSRRSCPCRTEHLPRTNLRKHIPLSDDCGAERGISLSAAFPLPLKMSLRRVVQSPGDPPIPPKGDPAPRPLKELVCCIPGVCRERRSRRNPLRVHHEREKHIPKRLCLFFTVLCFIL